MEGHFKTVDEALNMIRDVASEMGFKEADRGDDLRMGYANLIAKKKGVIR